MGRLGYKIASAKRFGWLLIDQECLNQNAWIEIEPNLKWEQIALFRPVVCFRLNIILWTFGIYDHFEIWQHTMLKWYLLSIINDIFLYFTLNSLVIKMWMVSFSFESVGFKNMENFLQIILKFIPNIHYFYIKSINHLSQN